MDKLQHLELQVLLWPVFAHLAFSFLSVFLPPSADTNSIVKRGRNLPVKKVEEGEGGNIIVLFQQSLRACPHAHTF